MEVSVLLFENFETLDVFGPVEIFGKVTEHISFYSLHGGIISNSHRVSLDTLPLDNIIKGTYVFLIPGGLGTRKQVHNTELINKIKQISTLSVHVLSVCTGSALLAKTGLLNGKRATSNKRSFEWVVSVNEKVDWIKKARWVVDGNFYTSSGVSAGMDMTLGFLADLHGEEFAGAIAIQIEYNWQKDKDLDDFCTSE